MRLEEKVLEKEVHLDVSEDVGTNVADRGDVADGVVHDAHDVVQYLWTPLLKPVPPTMWT